MTGKARESVEKLTVPQMAPDRLKEVPDSELLSVNRRLHQLWMSHFAGNQAMTAGDLNREDLANAALFVWAEMKRRSMSVSEDTSLWRAAHRLTKSWGPEEEEEEPEPVTLLREEVYAEAFEDGDGDGQMDALQDTRD